MDEIDIFNQFDDEDINDKPSIEKEYYCTHNILSSGFTLLMKLVLLTKKNKEAFFLIGNLLNENPATINQQNNEGWTALMLAVRNSNTCSTENTVEILINMGADLNLQDNNGATALGHSQIIKENNIFKMLVDAGADVNLQNIDGLSVLMGLVINNDANIIEKVKILIDAKADVNLQDKYGRSTLILACEYDNEEIIQLLINAGAYVNLRDNYDQTALIPACNRFISNITIVQLLINAGIDINSQNCKGNTALMFASARNEEANIVQIFIDAGANVNLKNNDGYTALDIVKMLCRMHIVELLTEAETFFTNSQGVKG